MTEIEYDAAMRRVRPNGAPPVVKINSAVKTLVAVLAAQRERLAVTRSEVGELCNVPAVVIKGIEDGEIDPPLSLLIAYAQHVKMLLRTELTDQRRIARH